MAQAREIRTLHRRGRSITELAAMHDLNPGTISRLVRGLTYREYGSEGEEARQPTPAKRTNKRRKPDTIDKAKAIRREFFARHKEGRGLISQLAQKYDVWSGTIRDMIRGQRSWAGVKIEAAPGPWPALRFDRREGIFLLDGDIQQ
jgi:IS30 family transposase